jgi:hypothetical protein
MDSACESEALPNLAHTPLQLLFPLSNSQTQLINDDVFRQNLVDSLPPDSLSFDSDYRKSQAISDLLAAELDTPVLNEINQYLHFVASPSYDNIDALHEQRIRHRTVVPAEDPSLIWCGLTRRSLSSLSRHFFSTSRHGGKFFFLPSKKTMICIQYPRHQRKGGAIKSRT